MPAMQTRLGQAHSGQAEALPELQGTRLGYPGGEATDGPAAEESREGEKAKMSWQRISGDWRIGRKVPLNVYAGDRPVCQCHTAEDARMIVAAMNAMRDIRELANGYGQGWHDQTATTTASRAHAVMQIASKALELPPCENPGKPCGLRHWRE